MILKYIGKNEYVDPFGRFCAVTGDLIDYKDDEAENILKEQLKLFEKHIEVKTTVKGE